MPSVIVLVIIGLWSAVLVPPLLQRRSVRVPRPSERPTAGAASIPMAAGTTSAASRAVATATAEAFRRASAPLTEAADPAPLDGTDDPWMPRSAADAHRRRIMVLAVLGAVAVITLASVPLAGPPALAGHVLVDLVLIGYGWLVHERQARARQREHVVRPLASTRRPAPGFMVDERFLDRSRRAG